MTRLFWITAALCLLASCGQEAEKEGFSEGSIVLALVTLGGNDMLRHIPEQETVDNLGEVLELVQAYGAEAVLLATPKPNLVRAAFQNLLTPEFYQLVADRYQVHLIESAVAEVI